MACARSQSLRHASELVDEVTERFETRGEERLARAREMARVAVEILRERGECTETDLIAAGFTSAEIADLLLLASGFVASLLPPHRTLN